MAINIVNTSRPQLKKSFEKARKLFYGISKVMFKRINDNYILAYMHVTLIFIYHLIRHFKAITFIKNRFLQALLITYFNSLIHLLENYKRIKSEQFPNYDNIKDENITHFFLKNFFIKGLNQVNNYFPKDQFFNDKIDFEKKYFENKKFTNIRKERILWITYRVAQSLN